MSDKKFIYFDIRGRAEIVRLVLAAANEVYEDVRITDDAWRDLKSTIRYGQLPILRFDNGKEMNESLAIARYYGRQANICGESDWEKYLVDRAIDTADDLFLKMKAHHFELDIDNKTKLGKELHDIHMPFYFDKLTKYIEEGGGDFVAGKVATMGDLMIIVLFDTLVKDKSLYPVLHNAYLKTIDALPGVKAYLAIRKETAY